MMSADPVIPPAAGVCPTFDPDAPDPDFSEHIDDCPAYADALDPADLGTVAAKPGSIGASHIERNGPAFDGPTLVDPKHDPRRQRAEEAARARTAEREERAKRNGADMPEDAPPGVAPLDRGHALPVIRSALDLDRVVTETLAHLPTMENLYRRNGTLVRVAPRETDPRQTLLEQARAANPDAPRPRGYVERTPGTPAIRPHTDATIDRALSRVVRFERLRRNRSGETTWVECPAPPRVLSNVLADGTWPGVVPLVGVSSCPLLRADGTIAQTSGYDIGTGHVLAIPKGMSQINDRPTHADAVLAVERLRKLVCDFPWETEADFAAWLALSLTLICRNAIIGPTPFFGVSANSKGSGKSRLVDIASIIVTGAGAARGAQPKDDGETQKLLTSIALEGDALLLVDNCDRPIGGGAFDRWATGDVWKDRLLGLNATLTAPITAVVAFTANNPIYIGDTVDRVLPIRLESPLEDPRARANFRIPNILDHVRRNRCAYLADLLTLPAAWYSDGCPCQPVTWGSFEGWAGVVPQILVYGGVANPMATRDGIAETDPAHAALCTVVREWRAIEALAGTNGLSVRELVERCYDVQTWAVREGREAMAEALSDLAPGRGREKVDVRRLGYSLRGSARRVIAGQRIVRALTAAHGGAPRWTVR